MKPSTRIAELKEYYFSKKLAEIAEMNNAGKQVINLGIGSPDIAPDSKVIASLIGATKQEKAFMYQPYKGVPELKTAFSNWYEGTYGVDTSNLEIYPLLGSKEGINFISLAYLDEGDKVLVPNPGYPTYAAATKIAGAKTINYSLTEKTEWQPNFEELESLVDDNCKLMWINYPNMPTGAKTNTDVLKRLVAFAKKHNILLCNDNPYSLILNENPTSIFNIAGAEEVAIELNSLSKSHNLAGARVGVMLGNNELLEPIFRVQSSFGSGMFKPLQFAAISSLNLDQEWIINLNKEYQRRKEIAMAILSHLNCDFDPNGVGMFVWAKTPANFKNGDELSDKILNEARVFITPGKIFGTNGEQFIRISLCASLDLLQESLNRIISNSN